MPQYIVESVVVHLVSYLLNHVLTGCNDVFVHNVRVFIVEHGDFRFGIKYEVFAGTLLPPHDVLDAESIGVEPWKEGVSDNVLDTFGCESQRFGSDQWTVAKIQSACICSMCIGNQEWVRIILLAL